MSFETGPKPSNPYKALSDGARYRAFFECVPIPVKIYSKLGECLSANSAWRQFFQYPPDQKFPNFGMDPLLKSLGLQGSIASVFKGGGEETRLVFYDPSLLGRVGSPRLLEFIICPIDDEEGRATEVALIIKDGIAADSKESEEGQRFLDQVSYILGQSLDYKMTLKSITDLAALKFADWCSIDILDENHEIELLAISHRDPEFERKGREFRERHPRTMKDDDSIARVIKTGKSILIEKLSDVYEPNVDISREHYEQVRAAGVKSLMLIPLVYQGKCRGVLSLASTREDHLFSRKELALATELGRRASLALDNAKLYSELKKKEETLKESVKARDEFLSIASHELRTPLTPLKMQLQSLLRLLNSSPMPEDSSRLRRMVESAHQQADRLVGLIDDLLDASRISAGKLELRYVWVNPSELVREVCDRYADQQVQCLIFDERDEKAFWDQLRIEQVLVNLVSNAIKYAPHQPIRVELRLLDHHAEISVHDNGPGIRLEDQSRIFERYERVQVSSSMPGLGLGLYISKQIVEAHHGSICVESQPGKGATFIVKLPVKP